MNIVNKLTWRHMMKNKRRTLVTIIGVIISVAMITAVATLSTSFLSLVQKEHIANEGEWHILYKNVNKDQLEAIRTDKHTEKTLLSRDLGYAYLDDSENHSKPYLFFKEYNDEGFTHFPIELSEGRLPEKEDEILISKHILTNAQVDLKVGDQITAQIGKRVVEGDEELNAYHLDQSFALQTEDGESIERLEQDFEQTYTIVGIMERPSWEPYIAPGFTVLSHLSEENLTDETPVNVSVVWKDVNRRTLKHAEQLGKTLNIEGVSVNNGLLRYYGVVDNEFLKTALYSVAAIVMSVIMIGSVSLIYNAFAISVSERSRHLGMLSSVGATKKQKRNSVFFEGFVIGIVSIPLGIISGILGIAITFHFINPVLERISEFSTKLTVVITPISIVIAVLVSALTIFISTYIPARRASRISAIDAIRQTADIKLSRKQVKTSKLVRKLFGIEAEFGLKNLKRNKRRYHATVFSLAISIILFLTVSFFGEQMRVTSNVATSGLNYDIKINQIMNAGESFSGFVVNSIAALEEVTNVSEVSYGYVETELNEDQVYDLLGSFVEDGKYNAVIELNILDDESLRSYAEEVGVSYDALIDRDHLSGILINVAEAPGKKIGEVPVVSMSPGDSLHLSVFDWDVEEDQELGDLEIASLTDIRPTGVVLGSGTILVVVSQEVFDELNHADHIESTSQLVLTSSDPMKTHEKLEKMLDQRMYINNPHKIRQEEEGIILIMSVFTYGFIALITLISVANIFNTISTSIALRKREFGMLKSVGMTPKGFNRMINYESLFYGIKSLLYGLPISGVIMYLIYDSMAGAFEYPFEVPWVSIFGVIVGVFLIVGSAMIYSSAKVKKENIIDALKQENL